MPALTPQLSYLLHLIPGPSSGWSDVTTTITPTSSANARHQLGAWEKEGGRNGSRTTNEHEGYDFCYIYGIYLVYHVLYRAPPAKLETDERVRSLGKSKNLTPLPNTIHSGPFGTFRGLAGHSGSFNPSTHLSNIFRALSAPAHDPTKKKTKFSVNNHKAPSSLRLLSSVLPSRLFFLVV